MVSSSSENTAKEFECVNIISYVWGAARLELFCHCGIANFLLFNGSYLYFCLQIACASYYQTELLESLPSTKLLYYAVFKAVLLFLVDYYLKVQMKFIIRLFYSRLSISFAPSKHLKIMYLFTLDIYHGYPI